MSLNLSPAFWNWRNPRDRRTRPHRDITPYKGLLYFDEADADLFFGREALTEHLAKHVMALAMDASSRFLAVVGASGSGKSSLVRAGLAVALKRAGWDVRMCSTPRTIR